MITSSKLAVNVFENRNLKLAQHTKSSKAEAL
jgi:hypothetical protein